MASEGGSGARQWRGNSPAPPVQLQERTSHANDHLIELAFFFSFSFLFCNLKSVPLLYTDRQCWRLSIGLFLFCWAVCSENYRGFCKQAIKSYLKTNSAVGSIQSQLQYSYDAITTATKSVNSTGGHS